MKNTWKGIRSIIPLQKTTNDSPKIISLEDHAVTDPRTIANTFISFFFSVVPLRNGTQKCAISSSP